MLKLLTESYCMSVLAVMTQEPSSQILFLQVGKQTLAGLPDPRSESPLGNRSSYFAAPCFGNPRLPF